MRVPRNGEMVEITDQQEMEQAIMEENRKKFHQVENVCPFLKDPLRKDFGEYGNKKGVLQVLQGEYSIPLGIDKYTQSFINACSQKKDPAKTTSMERNPMDFKTAWKRAKEKTSSRHLHFGHFKAAKEDDLLTMGHYYMAEIPF